MCRCFYIYNDPFSIPLYPPSPDTYKDLLLTLFLLVSLVLFPVILLPINSNITPTPTIILLLSETCPSITHVPSSIYAQLMTSCYILRIDIMLCFKNWPRGSSSCVYMYFILFFCNNQIYVWTSAQSCKNKEYILWTSFIGGRIPPPPPLQVTLF